MIGIPFQFGIGVPEGKGMVAVALGEERVGAGVCDPLPSPKAGGVADAGLVACTKLSVVGGLAVADAEPAPAFGGLDAERVQAESDASAKKKSNQRRGRVMECLGAMGLPP